MTGIVKLRVHLCGADTDMVGIKHVENTGPVSTCVDTDTATDPVPHAAILERTLQSSCPAAIRVEVRDTYGSLQPDG